MNRKAAQAGGGAYGTSPCLLLSSPKPAGFLIGRFGFVDADAVNYTFEATTRLPAICNSLNISQFAYLLNCVGFSKQAA